MDVVELSLELLEVFVELAPEFEFDGCSKFEVMIGVRVIDIVDEGEGVLVIFFEAGEQVFSFLYHLVVGLLD